MGLRRLLILRQPRPDTTASPEFRYLASWVQEEARAVWARVVVQGVRGPRESLLDQGNEHVLLIADDNVLIGRRSLARMQRELLDGADIVCPLPVASSPLLAEAPIYTLRGYERVESRTLDAPPPSARPVSHLPVSLWRFEALAEALAGGSIATLLDDRPLAEMAPRARAVSVGLCHRFSDYYGERRDDLLEHVPAGVREVLEIGCGKGVTGAFLRERLGCRVTGVELNPVAAVEAAKRLDRVISGDVLTVEIPGTYDLVIASELFEHLTEQEQFLARMRGLLNPGGTILLSVPNVGHYAVVEDLLAGRWDYLPIGLLCYTHYRFFTAATLESWVRRCGFSDVHLVAQRTELPERLRALAAHGTVEVDLDSLSTKGFYVLIRR